MTKSEVFTSTGVMPSEAPAGFVKAGETVEGVFQPGFLCYGVPIGTDAYVSAMLDLKIRELETEVRHMSGVLEDWGFQGSNPEFTEALALVLCIPSPLARTELEKRLGNQWLMSLGTVSCQHISLEMIGELDMTRSKWQ